MRSSERSGASPSRGPKPGEKPVPFRQRDDGLRHGYPVSAPGTSAHRHRREAGLIRRSPHLPGRKAAPERRGEHV
ncbi:MAG: hypothetical protein ACK559_21630 [bacterium]